MYLLKFIPHDFQSHDGGEVPTEKQREPAAQVEYRAVGPAPGDVGRHAVRDERLNRAARQQGGRVEHASTEGEAPHTGR